MSFHLLFVPSANAFNVIYITYCATKGAVKCAIVVFRIYLSVVFMLSISANDLKRNGIASIERVMSSSEENSVMVDVRGKAK